MQREDRRVVKLLARMSSSSDRMRHVAVSNDQDVVKLIVLIGYRDVAGVSNLKYVLLYLIILFNLLCMFS